MNTSTQAALEIAILSQELASECLFFLYKTRVPVLSGCVMLNCPIKFSNKAINKEIHKRQLVTDAQNCAPAAELQASNKTHPQTLLTEKLSVCPF